MRKILLILSIISSIIAITSCNTENYKIKKAVRNSFQTEDSYEYVSHSIVEILMDFNIRDSIDALQFKIENNESLIKSDSIRLNNCIEEKENSIRERSTTLYYLRGLYDDIISKWQDMEDDISDKISSKKKLNDSLIKNISFYKNEIDKSNNGLIFYKIKCTYKSRGVIKEKIIYLDNSFNKIQLPL